MRLYNKHWAPQDSAGIPQIFLALFLIRNEASTRDASETTISRLNKNYQSKPLLHYMHFPSSPEEASHARGTSHCQQWRQTVDVWDDYISLVTRCSAETKKIISWWKSFAKASLLQRERCSPICSAQHIPNSDHRRQRSMRAAVRRQSSAFKELFQLGHPWLKFFFFFF